MSEKETVQALIAEYLISLLPSGVDELRRAASEKMGEMLPGVEFDIDISLSEKKEIVFNITKRF